MLRFWKQGNAPEVASPLLGLSKTRTCLRSRAEWIGIVTNVMKALVVISRSHFKTIVFDAWLMQDGCEAGPVSGLLPNSESGIRKVKQPTKDIPKSKSSAWINTIGGTAGEIVSVKTICC